MIVFLDSGILGLISSPNERVEVTAYLESVADRSLVILKPIGLVGEPR